MFNQTVIYPSSSEEYSSSSDDYKTIPNSGVKKGYTISVQLEEPEALLNEKTEDLQETFFLWMNILNKKQQYYNDIISGSYINPSWDSNILSRKTIYLKWVDSIKSLIDRKIINVKKYNIQIKNDFDYFLYIKNDSFREDILNWLFDSLGELTLNRFYQKDYEFYYSKDKKFIDIEYERVESMFNFFHKLSTQPISFTHKYITNLLHVFKRKLDKAIIKYLNPEYLFNDDEELFIMACQYGFVYYNSIFEFTNKKSFFQKWYNNYSELINCYFSN